VRETQPAPAPSVAAAPLSGAPSSDRPIGRALQWVVDHDEKIVFTLAYVTLAVVLSVWISLFWLLVVVGVHFLLELVRQRHLHARPGTVLLEAAWELRLDVALVLLALVVALYMELILGVAGLQGVARAGQASRVVARFSGWERTIRGIMLSVDDAFHLVRFAGRRRGGAPAAPAPEAAPGSAPRVGEWSAPSAPAVGRWGSWSGPWSTGAWLTLVLAGVSALLIVLSPALTGHGTGGVIQILSSELRPFP
jgi:hypothetical protein